MEKMRTDQENFWAGSFGSEYISRNNSDQLLESNVSFFAEILRNISFDLSSVVELGANIGMNYRALSKVLPELSFTGVEINPDAFAELKSLGCNAHLGSLLDFRSEEKFDLTFTKGVLIHINPKELPRAYDSLHQNSKKYVLIAEYYNPSPVEVSYRGFAEKLFKRDFAGDFLDRFPESKLISYGFRYHRDEHPQDDISWFLIRK